MSCESPFNIGNWRYNNRVMLYFISVYHIYFISVDVTYFKYFRDEQLASIALH